MRAFLAGVLVGAVLTLLLADHATYAPPALLSSVHEAGAQLLGNARRAQAAPQQIACEGASCISPHKKAPPASARSRTASSCSPPATSRPQGGCTSPACAALSAADWEAQPPPVSLPLHYRARVGPKARSVARGALTVMLTVFKRHKLAQQIAALDAQTLRPQQIHVFQTGSHVADTAALIASLNRSDISLIHVTGYDFKYHARFLPLLMADTEYVAVLDDDTIPQRRWFQRAVEFIEARGPTTVVGSTGRRAFFNHTAAPGGDGACTSGGGCASFTGFGNALGLDGIEQANPVEVDFVIHNYVARAELMRYFFALPHYTWLNGEDISFCASLQVAVGARCWTPAQSAADESMGDPENAGGDAVASFQRGGHKEIRGELAHHWIDLGWRPLNLKGAEMSSVVQLSGAAMTRQLWPPA